MIDIPVITIIDKEADWPSIEPEVTPVSCIDVDRAKGAFDMHLPMADLCPACGGCCLQVGDYVCWGFCFRCYRGKTP